MCIERVDTYELGRGRDTGRGRDAGRKRDTGRERNMGREKNVGREKDVGRKRDVGSEGRGFALRAACCSSAMCARTFVVAEQASGFTCLLDCSPAPYGSSSAVHLWLGLPMCSAVRVLSTLPLACLLFCFTPIHMAVSSQKC
jgi:hypothetical protein